MITDTLKLFLHSVEKDIEYLEGLKADASILNKLRGLLDNVRSQWAYIYSNDKKGYGNRIGAYFALNVDVNKVYDEIVLERVVFLNDNPDVPFSPVDDFVLKELFLTYTIFLDAYSELGFYYVICKNYPFEQAAFFATQKSLRVIAKRLDKKDDLL